MRRPATSAAMVLCAITLNARAVEIGFFPGFPKLIQQSDAIVILRIDHQVDPDSFESKLNLYTIHDCFLYQVLKGDLPPQMRLKLMDVGGQPYAPGSVHLVFLSQDAPGGFRTMAFEGANIRLSPLGQEKPPEGKTLLEKIQRLVRASIDYSRQNERSERSILKALLRGRSPLARSLGPLFEPHR